MDLLLVPVLHSRLAAIRTLDRATPRHILLWVVHHHTLRDFRSQSQHYRSHLDFVKRRNQVLRQEVAIQVLNRTYQMDRLLLRALAISMAASTFAQAVANTFVQVVANTFVQVVANTFVQVDSKACCRNQDYINTVLHLKVFHGVYP